MSYPKLPDFDTAVFNPATLTPTELCNQLKRHYDYLMTAVATHKIKWDSIDYNYHTNGQIHYIDYNLGSIKIRKQYYYVSGRLDRQINYIRGVPPAGSAWQLIHAQTYNYDTGGRLISITDRQV